MSQTPLQPETAVATTRRGLSPAARRSRLAGLAVIAMATVALAAQVTWVATHLDEIRPVSPGDVAPLFTLPSVDHRGRIAADGVRLQELRGDVVVVEFWATWCGPCKQSLPAVESIYQRYRDRGLHVLSVNTDDPAYARRIMDGRGYTMPLYVDDGRAADAYKVNTVPHLVVIDKHGLIRHIHRGFQGEGVLDRQVAKLLN